MLSAINISISKIKPVFFKANTALHSKTVYLNGSLDENLNKNPRFIHEVIPFGEFPQLEESFERFDIIANSEQELLYKFGINKVSNQTNYNLETSVEVKNNGILYLVLINITQDLQSFANDYEKRF